jgi:putative ABC transport system substrate-binding protein
MRRRTRRRLLQGSLVMVLSSLLSGCERPAKAPRIGFLAVGSREGRAFLINGFQQGLREHGYVEGQNILIEYRFSEGRNDRLPELAAELVNRKVKLILASGSPASFAAKDATRTIPIVMGSLAANPIDTGLISSLSRPGGNITGMTEMASEHGAKRLELLKQIVPSLSRVAVFWNPPNPAYGPVLKALEAAAPAMGVALQRLEVGVPEDFESALQTATRQRADALSVHHQSLPGAADSVRRLLPASGSASGQAPAQLLVFLQHALGRCLELLAWAGQQICDGRSRQILWLQTESLRLKAQSVGLCW